MMRGRERRHRRRIIRIVCAVAVPVLAAGVWLLFFSGGGKTEVAAQPVAPDAAVTSAETPEESVLGVSTNVAQSPIDPNDWRLLLVNAQHSLPEGFEVSLTELKNGQAVDERCYPDLQQMMDDCRAAGLQPLICSSYRTQERQQELFDNKVARLKQQGLSDEEAYAQAATVIAVPGTSEHQTGLAVDIVDYSNQNLDESQESTPVQQWLHDNCGRYGFILRYLKDKAAITGISYESWHYRYVGREAAQAMDEQGLCLEEYLERAS
jgi:D-alanyl-D-alanine carboxypeptidase